MIENRFEIEESNIKEKQEDNTNEIQDADTGGNQDNKKKENVINNPKTSDDIVVCEITFMVALIGIFITILINRKLNKK